MRMASMGFRAKSFNHMTFLDLQTMFETLSPRRLDLLRHVRQHGAGNVRELAQTLGRDYKNVHQDVATLQSAGFLACWCVMAAN